MIKHCSDFSTVLHTGYSADKSSGKIQKFYNSPNDIYPVQLIGISKMVLSLLFILLSSKFIYLFFISFIFMRWEKLEK